MSDSHYKALLIGNGTFDRDPHKLFPLQGPVNDLRVLRAALTHPAFGLFDANNVRHLFDGTHAEVLEAIETFFSDAGPEDHLLFYYSGHGYPDTNNNLYLCARNTRTNLLGSSAIPDKTINLMAENSRARKFIFVLDCCHSGGFKGGTAGVQLAHGSGRCLITACASDQLSSDSRDADGASTFTHFLAEALTCGAVDSDGDGVVLTSEVFKYVQPRVYNATKQTVQWSMDKTFGEAAIARAERRNPTTPPIPPSPRPSPDPGRPMLELSETRIEFRDVQPGEKLPVERVDVFNSGDGALDWVFESEETWISAERKGDSLFVKLDTTEIGLRRGNLFVRDRGRGGSKTIRVLLQVIEPAEPRKAAPITPAAPPPLPEPPPPPAIDPLVQALPGWWMNDMGALLIRSDHGALHYTDHNLMGIKVGQGTLQLQNGIAFVQGAHSFTGPYTGQLSVQGHILSGSLMSMGRMVPVMFMRQNPWFASFVR